MYLYAVCDGLWNSYNQDYAIISVHSTPEGAIEKWRAVKQQTAKRITNPHFFTVKKIKVED